MLSLVCSLVALAAPGDLSALRSLTETVHHLKARYATPQTIVPRQLVIAALEGAGRAEPLVHSTKAKDDLVIISIANESQSFNLSRIDSLWKAAFALKDAGEFMERALAKQKGIDANAIEVAMIDAMLRALEDGHSRVTSGDQPDGASLEGSVCVERITLKRGAHIRLVVSRETCAP